MITLALDRYDRHLPFFDGTVRLPEGLDIRLFQVGAASALRDGGGRHERMLQDGEFDAAEMSLASYIVAKSRGLPFTAIPVFPRRLFSQGQIFVHTKSGIASPRDLAGRTVGLQSFQTTLAVLAKGDLAAEYGVPLTSIKWRVKSADTIEIDHVSGFDIAPLPAGVELAELLCTGAIDALFYSRTPQPPAGLEGGFRRLFADPKAEEARFVEKNGYWPIMHLVALKQETVDDNPALPAMLMQAFDDARRVAAKYLDDPNWSRQPWAKYTAEEERRSFDGDLWVSGLSANRKNLDRFIGYAHDQGLIGRSMTASELFHPSVIDS
jgi:4,5-dihydroxyphthalate decarboxylase